MGGNLARKWSWIGHDVFMGVRNAGSTSVQGILKDTGDRIKIGSVKEACNHGEILVLAIPYWSLENLLESIPDPGQKIVVDCINPVEWQDGPIKVRSQNSTGILTERWPDAQVVKAFNTVASDQVLTTSISGEPIDMYFCSDDEEAGETIAELAESMELNPIDCGPLRNASMLENLAILMMALAYTTYHGNSINMKLVYD